MKRYKLIQSCGANAELAEKLVAAKAGTSEEVIEEATETPEEASLSTGTKGNKKDALAEKRDRINDLAFGE